jgi:hypothetical protein
MDVTPQPPDPFLRNPVGRAKERPDDDRQRMLSGCGFLGLVYPVNGP